MLIMRIISNSSNNGDVKTEPVHVFHGRRVMYDVGYYITRDNVIVMMLGLVVFVFIIVMTMCERLC